MGSLKLFFNVWFARRWGISEDAEVMMKSPNTTEDIERAGAS